MYGCCCTGGALKLSSYRMLVAITPARPFPQVYKILMRHTAVVQPLSCDEAYLDVTGLGDPEAMVASIRREIQSATGCNASAGIGPNLLLARLATAKAKPNGQHIVRQSAALQFLEQLPVDEIPGVGWSTSSKMADLGITRVRTH